MKRLNLTLAVAAVMLGTAFIPAQPAEAKSIGQMLNSAINAINRQSNPYGYNGYGYGANGGYYGSPYGNAYGYPYTNNYVNPYANSYANPYGYNPYGYGYSQSSTRSVLSRLLNGLF